MTERSRLGRSSFTVTRLGFGGWATGGHSWGNVDDASSAAAIDEALRHGIDLFDTADVYGFGHSERLLHQALGPARSRVVLTTKFGVAWGPAGTRKDLSPGHLSRAIEASLERLGVDVIPVYIMHWPDGVTPIGETMAALERLRERGVVREIGCSNFPPELIEAAQAHGRVDVMQLPFNVIRGAEGAPLLATAAKHSMGVIAFDALAKGLLSARLGDATTFPPTDLRSRDPEFRSPRYERNVAIARTLAEIGTERGVSAAAVALRWVLDHPGIHAVLAGMKTPAQVRENVQALGWRLSTSELDRIRGVAISPELLPRG